MITFDESQRQANLSKHGIDRRNVISVRKVAKHEREAWACFNR